MAAQGTDLIRERARMARELARGDNTLRAIAKEVFETRKAELKGDGNAGLWFSPPVHHVLPKSGRVPIEEIDQRDIRDPLAPNWHTKADTARKAMNRLGIFPKHDAVLGQNLKAMAKAKAGSPCLLDQVTPRNHY